jgi:beta-phosphoglucomutase-like phosphatase (HAD superfamily)
MSLEITDLTRFFEPTLFSASNVRNGKPAPDLLLHVARRMQVDPRDCIVVEDSPVRVAAGMTVIGFVGGSHLGRHLQSIGAHAAIADMGALKGTIIDIRGW